MKHHSSHDKQAEFKKTYLLFPWQIPQWEEVRENTQLSPIENTDWVEEEKAEETEDQNEWDILLEQTLRDTNKPLID